MSTLDSDARSGRSDGGGGFRSLSAALSRRLSGLVQLIEELRPSEPEPPPTPPVIEGYDITEFIGEGGMGAVWKATDLTLKADVAIKVAHEHAEWEQGGEGFLGEARSMASVRHPNIVHIYSFGDSSGREYLVMEYVLGQSLAEHISAAPIEQNRALEIAESVAVALEAACQRGMIHRDVKPSNILIDESDWVRVCDFGLAKPVVVDASNASTDSGTVVGTPHYMSPEQATGRPVDFRADVYSLGIVLYEMLAGAPPFHGRSPQELIVQHVRDPLPPVGGGVAPEIVALIDWMTHKDPAQRPSSYAELRDRIGELRQTNAATSVPRWRYVVPAIVASATLAVTAVWLMLPLAPPPGPVRHEPLVTSEWSELAPRISPDGEWFSFISDRGGTPGLWIRPRAGGDERPLVEADGTVTGHAWSSDGDRVAYLVQLPDGLYLFTGSPWSSTPELSVRIGTIDSEARLVRWVADSIYLFFPKEFTLRRLHIAEEVATVRDAIPDGFPHRLNSVDVDAGGNRIVYSALDDNDQEDLWVADLERATDPERLTNDEFRQYGPRWMGAAAESVVYLTNESGEIDIWEIGVGWQFRQSITSSAAVEGELDVAIDGSMIVYESHSEESDIWALHGDAAREQLTSNTLHEFFPSSSGGALAFQRSRTTADAYDLFNAQILLADWPSGGSSTNQRTLAESGFAPTVSADGRRVAFLQQPPGSLRTAALYVVDTSNRETARLTGSFVVPAFNIKPLYWYNQNLTWVGETLYFVEIDADGRYVVRGADFSSAAAPMIETVFQAGNDVTSVVNLRGSPDGRRLTLVVLVEGAAAGERAVWDDISRAALVEVEIASGEHRVLHQGAAGRRVYNIGWYHDTPVVVSATRDPSGLETSQVLRLTAGGWRQVGADVRNSLGAAAVLSELRGSLVIGVLEQGVHNLWELMMDTGELVALTPNTAPNVAFGCLSSEPAGRLLYCRQRQGRDLRLTTFAR